MSDTTLDYKWFTENYIENRLQCEFLILKAEQKGCYTKDEIFQGCFELRKGRCEIDSLETHLKLLVNMADLGIVAFVGGRHLRNAMLESKATRLKQ